MKLLLLSGENACYNLDNATTIADSQWARCAAPSDCYRRASPRRAHETRIRLAHLLIRICEFTRDRISRKDRLVVAGSDMNYAIAANVRLVSVQGDFASSVNLVNRAGRQLLSPRFPRITSESSCDLGDPCPGLLSVRTIDGIDGGDVKNISIAFRLAL